MDESMTSWSQSQHTFAQDDTDEDMMHVKPAQTDEDDEEIPATPEQQHQEDSRTPMEDDDDNVTLTPPFSYHGSNASPLSQQEQEKVVANSPLRDTFVPDTPPSASLSSNAAGSQMTLYLSPEPVRCSICLPFLNFLSKTTLPEEAVKSALALLEFAAIECLLDVYSPRALYFVSPAELCELVDPESRTDHQMELKFWRTLHPTIPLDLKLAEIAYDVATLNLDAVSEAELLRVRNLDDSILAAYIGTDIKCEEGKTLVAGFRNVCTNTYMKRLKQREDVFLAKKQEEKKKKETETSQPLTSQATRNDEQPPNLPFDEVYPELRPHRTRDSRKRQRDETLDVNESKRRTTTTTTTITTTTSLHPMESVREPLPKRHCVPLSTSPVVAALPRSTVSRPVRHSRRGESREFPIAVDSSQTESDQDSQTSPLLTTVTTRQPIDMDLGDDDTKSSQATIPVFNPPSPPLSGLSFASREDVKDSDASPPGPDNQRLQFGRVTRQEFHKSLVQPPPFLTNVWPLGTWSSSSSHSSSSSSSTASAPLSRHHIMIVCNFGGGHGFAADTMSRQTNLKILKSRPQSTAIAHEFKKTGRYILESPGKAFTNIQNKTTSMWASLTSFINAYGNQTPEDRRRWLVLAVQKNAYITVIHRSGPRGLLYLAGAQGCLEQKGAIWTFRKHVYHMHQFQPFTAKELEDANVPSNRATVIEHDLQTMRSVVQLAKLLDLVPQVLDWNREHDAKHWNSYPQCGCKNNTDHQKNTRQLLKTVGEAQELARRSITKHRSSPHDMESAQRKALSNAFDRVNDYLCLHIRLWDVYGASAPPPF